MRWARSVTALSLIPASWSHCREAPSTRDITWQEVKENSTEQSCYIAIDGLVYDVTRFLRAHPGGSRIVLNAAGKDATDVFHNFHKRSVLQDVAAPYLIGRTVGDMIQTASETTTTSKTSTATGRFHVERCNEAEIQSLVNIKAFEMEALKRFSMWCTQ